MRCSFIRYISHELRSPLNTISLGLNIIRRSNEVDVNQVLSEMAVACDQNIGVLNDLATFEQFEREDLHIFLSDVFLHEFVLDVLSHHTENVSDQRQVTTQITSTELGNLPFVSVFI